MAEYLTLDDIYDRLVEHQDITITIPISQVEVIRKGISKRKHKEKTSFGEFADPDAIFKSAVIKQTEDEMKKDIVRLRLYLEAKHKVEVLGVQVNDEDF